MLHHYLAAVGLILSLYALLVEIRLKYIDDYKPRCDFSKNISCSKAFQSKFGHILKVPNALVGAVFYVLIFFAEGNYLQNLVYIGMLATLILAYLSYIKQRNFCLVCSAVYIVNIALLVSV